MIKIDTKDLQARIDWIAGIQDGDGAGTTRLLYSPSWRKAQEGLKERFLAIGMKAEYDEIGNLFGTVIGTEDPHQVIASGSHVDTVVNGGPLDGQFGIIAAHMAIEKLVEEYGKPKKSLRVISMAEEEGSRFPCVYWGSKNIFGEADVALAQEAKDANGVLFVDAMREAGFDFLHGQAKFKDMAAFVELHIEQGNALEMSGESIGVVDAIVGQKRYTITLDGQANHAGTTRMRYRKDCVEAGARIITSALDKAKAAGDPLVLTFGRFEPFPNTVNVVPGKVIFSMDCRHTDQEFLHQFTDEIVADMKTLCHEMGISIEIDNWMDEPPVPMDEQIVSVIEEAVQTLGHSYQRMHSGAGHDSQIIAPKVPTAMIFTPSIDGISHNPAESTKIEELAMGVEVLAETLRRLAY